MPDEDSGMPDLDACGPIAETCNGMDDDCDSMVDEDFADLGTACTAGMGACSATGTVVCSADGSASECDAVAGMPGTETCDNTDEDCDGTIDNGVTMVCYTGPAGTSGIGVCVEGVATCDAGTFGPCTGEVVPGAETCNGLDDNCDGTNDDMLGSTTCGTGACQRTVENCVGGAPQMCVPGTPGAETCDNTDEDCDGTIDNAVTRSCYTGPAGTMGVGVCAAGTETCSAGVFGACTGQVTPTAEVCNGLDDDCNGTVDDGLGTSTCGTGACQRTVMNCVGGAPQTCTPGAPAAETCNNIDDNCDGTIDDAVTRSCYGGPAGTLGVGVCAAGTETCSAGVFGACTGDVQPSAETCDGLDNDCNASTDDGLGSTTCGVGECTRTTMNCIGGMSQMCVPGMAAPEVCDGLDQDCNGTADDGLGQTTCGTGVCQRTVDNCVGGMPTMCMPGAPGAETCNGLDDDCDGMSDEGLGSTTCGVGACMRTTMNCVGGMPQMCMPGTPAAEVCGNGIDEDCDGIPDDGCAVPGNECATAIPLVMPPAGTRRTVTGTTVGSTNSTPSCTPSPDIWYSFTLTTRSIVYVDTFGSGYDTFVGFASSCAGPTTGCSDDACGTLSTQTSAILPAGTHYIIMDGFSGAGAFTLNFEHLPVSGTSVGILPPGAYTRSGNTTGEPNTPGSCTGGPDEFYHWFTCPTAPAGTFTGNTCGMATWDTVLQVRHGNGPQSCVDDTCGLQTMISAPVPAGAGLHVFYIDGFSAGSFGAYTVTGNRP